MRRVLVTDALAAAMSAWILETAGLSPGFVFDRTSIDFDARTRPPSSRRRIVGTKAAPAPYVVAGAPNDLEPDDVHVFGGEPFTPPPSPGLVVADVRWAGQLADRDPVYVGMDRDASDTTPAWLAATAPSEVGVAFDLYAGGSYAGRFTLAHGDTRSALLAIAACAHAFDVPLEQARRALMTFRGFA